ncbi:MAG: ABC transporter permease [Clostridiales bacterium]|jgi:multidrug/hemolysin transport system permease protein|nr:ABC transporter permease [Clostridiales bacterium]
MTRAIALAKRNSFVFLRSGPTLFFSFLSSIIIVGLYILFIANTYTAELSSFLPASEASFLVYVQMLAGIIIINSLSLAVGSYSVIASDFENRKVDSFLLAQAKAPELIASYFIQAFMVSFLMNLLLWLASLALIGGMTGFMVSFLAILQSVPILAFASFVSCSILLLFTALVKSSSAISVMNGVSGTIFGFLCGIYMPFSLLGKGVEKIGSALPFTHMAVWLKSVALEDAIRIVGIPAESGAKVLESFSAQNVGFIGINVPMWGMLIYTAAIGLACLAIASVVLKRRIAN